MFLSKTQLSLLSTGSTQEDPSRHRLGRTIKRAEHAEGQRECGIWIYSAGRVKVMNIISDHIANVISVYTKELNKKNAVYISEPRHERKKDYVPISHAMLPMPF